MIEVLRVTRGETFYFSQLNEEIDALNNCHETDMKISISRNMNKNHLRNI